LPPSQAKNSARLDIAYRQQPIGNLRTGPRGFANANAQIFDISSDDPSFRSLGVWWKWSLSRSQNDERKCFGGMAMKIWLGGIVAMLYH
jgi:hypothetical protein